MSLTLYQLPISPNNVKIRVALGIKGLSAELVNFDLGGDRSAVIEATGQPLTPAISHDGTVLFGSGAILRYLDANFRDQGPRLFSETQEGMREIEDWEHWANKVYSQSTILIAQQFFSGQDDPEGTQKANELLVQNAPRIEEALAKNGFLLGDAPTAADCTLFPWANYTALDPATAQGPAALFAGKLQLPAEFPKTHAWIERMRSFDRRV